MKGVVSCLVLALAGRASAQQFDAGDQVGGITGGAQAGPTTTPNAPNTALPDFNIPLSKPRARSIGPLPRICACGTVNLDTSDIQSISDTWCNGGGASGNSYGLSNLVWGWGQFMDHEIVGTIDDESGPSYVVNLANSRTMTLHRVRSLGGGTCPNPVNIHTGTIDGAVVYSPQIIFEKKLRKLPGCHLREGDQPGFLPLTTRADDQGRFFIVAGDGRVDEHAALTSMHTLWMREHNRLCDVIETMPSLANKSPNQKFNIAKAVVTAKLQQITVTGFLPALGIVQADLQAAAASPKVDSSLVSVEFQMAYRLGHTMIPDNVGNLAIADLFDGQNFYLTNENGGVGYKANADSLLNNIFTQMAGTQASEMDGKLSNALRNILFGDSFQEDLCARNVFRGREMGLPTYAGIATCFGTTPDPTVEAETPDMFLGLLREPRAPGSPLGPTHKAILAEQFGRAIFGPKGNWWKTDNSLSSLTTEFAAEIDATTLAQVITQNTGASVSGNAFAA